MILRISEEGYAVIEILSTQGDVVRTIPLGHVEYGAEYHIEGVEAVP